MMQFDGMNMRYINNGGASYTGDAQGALDEVYTNSGNWNGVVSTVSDNSGSWTGGGGGGVYSESALLYQGSKSDQQATAWALSGNIQDYSMIQCDWVDVNNFYISKQIPIPSGLGTDCTRAAFFDAVYESWNGLWCKAQRFSAQQNHVYAQVDEYCVRTGGGVGNLGNNVQSNRPIMVQIIGIR